MEVKKKSLDIVREKVRFKHYSISTERTYIHLIKHYIFYHNKKHPMEMRKVLRLRIKDIDFGFNKVYIWDSKSLKDITVPLPLKLKQKLLIQIEAVCEIHSKDLNLRLNSLQYY